MASFECENVTPVINPSATWPALLNDAIPDYLEEMAEKLWQLGFDQNTYGITSPAELVDELQSFYQSSGHDILNETVYSVDPNITFYFLAYNGVTHILTHDVSASTLQIETVGTIIDDGCMNAANDNRCLVALAV